ncbi:MAG: hypothetical protein WCE62_17980 [Polyangiales bacterium]
MFQRLVIFACCVLILACESSGNQEFAQDTKADIAFHIENALHEQVEPAVNQKSEIESEITSMEYPQAHSSEALRALEPTLLTDNAPGKWESMRLVGQFGDAQAIEVLHDIAMLGLTSGSAKKDGNRSGGAPDELNSVEEEEEIVSRLQAVGSIGDIAARRPDLSQLAIDRLMEIAHAKPEFRGMVSTQLFEFLGPAGYAGLADSFPDSGLSFRVAPSPEDLRAMLSDPPSESGTTEDE